MTTVLLFFNVLLMIAFAVGLGVYISRRWQTRWHLYLIGAVTFVGAQIFHIPFNMLVQQRLGLLPEDTTVFANLVIVSIFLGLSAGVFEEAARYLTYRFWARDARSWRKGMMLGAGHGGIEAILIGLLGLANLILFVAIRDGAVDIATVVSPEQVELLQNQIDQTFGVPWYMAILGAVERLFALALHLSLSLIVLQSFLRQNRLWLLAAILWHAFANAVAVITLETWGPLAAEGALLFFGLASVAIIYRSYQEREVATDSDNLSEPVSEAIS